MNVMKKQGSECEIVKQQFCKYFELRRNMIYQRYQFFPDHRKN